MTGRALRLPTEAEWEFAAGGGEPGTAFAGTDSPASIGRFAWFAGNSGDRCHPVGIKEPNSFGLYDMSGNVWEWCLVGPGRGGAQEGSGDGVLKGGSWREEVDSLRLSARAHRQPNWLGKGCLPAPLVPSARQMDDVGFRVAIDLVAP